MNKLLVIADDLTGAAEVAGVGHRVGLRTDLLRFPTSTLANGLTVIDTNSRLLSRDDAVRAVARFVEPLIGHAFDLIYKKMDSVLRGQPRAEVLELLRLFRLKRALLAPQNPSRGRTISAGVYRIDGVPLDQTAFKDDPDHPARSAIAAEVLEIGASDPMLIGDAESMEQMLALAGSVGPAVLAAGSGDFFQAILQGRGLTPSRPFIERLDAGPTLFVCGSASAYSRELPDLARRHGVAVSPMPENPGIWADAVVGQLSQGKRVLMTIGRPVDRAVGASARLQAALTEAVENVLSLQPVTNLLVDGGATAASICHASDWTQFHIVGELAPGAVMLRVAETNLAIKPGSYHWPDGVFEGCAESR